MLNSFDAVIFPSFVDEIKTCRVWGLDCALCASVPHSQDCSFLASHFHEYNICSLHIRPNNSVFDEHIMLRVQIVTFALCEIHAVRFFQVYFYSFNTHATFPKWHHRTLPSIRPNELLLSISVTCF